VKVSSRAALYGAAGIGLAGLVIFSGSSFGLLDLASSGTLSVLLTDPPTVPDGVSAVYVTYSNIEVHAVGSEGSGWVSVAGHGTVDTMKLVNLSQSISTGVVPTLAYNQIALNITGAVVEFNGRNYTAAVALERLVVPIDGDLRVNSSSPAAALVDFQPTVINLGTESSPDFTLTSGARALQVPGSAAREFLRVGTVLDLVGRGWYQSFAANRSEELGITNVAVGTGTFSVTISNPGAEPYTVRLITVSPDTQGARPSTVLGSLINSVVFVVDQDGSLTQAAGGSGQLRTALGSSGFTIPSHSSHTFTFSGTLATLVPRAEVSKGSSYFVVVFGSESPLVETATAD